MVAKQKRRQSNDHQNMEQTDNPTIGAAINNESSTEPPHLNELSNTIRVIKIYGLVNK